MALFVGWAYPYPSPKLEVIPEEHARFENLGASLEQKLREKWCISGRDMYHHADGTPITLNNSGPTWPYFSPYSIPPLMEGWRWPIPNQPFRDIMLTSPKKMRDIIGTSFNTYAISERVIDLIEEVEPGVHQFLPYDLVTKSGLSSTEKRWLLNVTTRIEAINVALSSVAKAGMGLNDYRERSLVVRKEFSETRAIWHEFRYRGPSPMISDRFWKKLRAAGCTGWSQLHSWPHIPEF